MTPTLPAELNEDHQHHKTFTPNLQASSSSSLSTHILFNSTSQDQSRYYHREIQQRQDQNMADKFASHGGSYDIETESDNGLKFSIWKKEDRNENKKGETIFQVKWMSSKMRLMNKMKNSDQTGGSIPTSTTTKLKHEDQKQLSSPMETDNISNSSSNDSNNPIRVCSDCNTTKTPLWRSGPRGPKSLCNACGIRQRKARRAMAAAVAANGTILPTETSPMKPKAQQKDKKSYSGHVAKYKKGCKHAATPSHGREKLCFEDFLISLSKNLAFHRVFPQDEKEAAILLMALSCGHVHG